MKRDIQIVTHIDEMDRADLEDACKIMHFTVSEAMRAALRLWVLNVLEGATDGD